MRSIVDKISIQSAVAKLREIEQKILVLLDDYNKETGLVITDIRVNYISHYVTDLKVPSRKMRDCILTQVQCEAKL